jgi:hypothetical protein
MQRLYIFSLSCLFEVLKAFCLVSVFLIAEIEGCEIVECPGEVLFCCLFVVVVSFLVVRLKYLSVGFLVLEAVFV